MNSVAEIEQFTQSILSNLGEDIVRAACLSGDSIGIDYQQKGLTIAVYFEADSFMAKVEVLHAKKSFFGMHPPEVIDTTEVKFQPKKTDTSDLIQSLDASLERLSDTVKDDILNGGGIVTLTLRTEENRDMQVEVLFYRSDGLVQFVISSTKGVEIS
jgi:hypothetical protein